MKQTGFRKVTGILAAFALSSVAVASAAVQQQNLQLAVQLGAIQLGYKTPASPQSLNPSQLSTALSQGEKALNGTVPATQLYQATSLALSSPVTSLSLGLNPALTTPAAILSLATARNPALATSLVAQAVEASLSHTTDAHGVVHPSFGPQPSPAAISAAGNTSAGLLALNTQTEAAQRRIAAESARVALNATLDSQAIGMKLSNKNITPTETAALAKQAALVTQNAVSGLGEVSGIGLYGKTDANVVALTQQLTVTTTAFYQELSSASGNSIASLSVSPNLKTLLGGVVSGAVSAAPSSAPAIATGLANGYYVSSMNATGSAVNFTSFKANNTASLVSLFSQTSTSAAALTSVINGTIDDTHVQIANGAPYSAGVSNPGKYGVNENGLLLPSSNTSNLLPAGSLLPTGAVNTGGINSTAANPYTPPSATTGFNNVGPINGVGSAVTSTTGR